MQYPNATGLIYVGYIIYVFQKYKGSELVEANPAPQSTQNGYSWEYGKRKYLSFVLQNL